MILENIKFRWILVCICLVFLVLRVPVLFKDLAVEEGTFIRTGVAYLEKGKPEIYLDEIRPVFVNFDKPPLSRVLIGFGYKIGGDSIIGARLVPFLFGLFHFVLLYYLIQRFYKGDSSNIVLYGSLALYSVLPLVIHEAGEIQIDYIVSFFLTIYLFGVFSVVNRERTILSNPFVIFFSLFLAFASKYEPTLMAVLIANLYGIFKRVGWRTFLKVNAFSAGAIFLYFGLFYFYILKMFGDTAYFWQPIQIIEGVIRGFFMPKFEIVSDAGVTGNFWSNALLLKAFINFVSLSLFFLVFKAIFAKNNRSSFMFFNALILIVFMSIYIGVGWFGLGFPRYFDPVVISLVFLASLNFPSVFSFIKRHKVVSFLIVISIFIVYFLMGERSSDFFIINNPFVIVIGIGVLFVILAVISFVKKCQLATLLSFLCLVYFLVFAVFRIQTDVFSNKIVTAAYGQNGVAEAGLFLKTYLNPSKDLIVTNDNIAFYYGDNFYFWDNIEPYPKILEDFIANHLKNVKAFVIPEESINRNFALKDYIEANRMRRKTVGTMVIFY